MTSNNPPSTPPISLPPTTTMKLTPIATFSPTSQARAWQSIPHPTLPLLASASSDKIVRVYSLQNFLQHSSLDGGHKRSVRSVAWKPHLAPSTLSLVTGSFDATAGIWRRHETPPDVLETEITSSPRHDNSDDEDSHDWEFSLVLEGHDSEIKSVAFSPSGQYLATCSRDKSVWIWEEIGADGEDEWETVAVLQEHEGDVKAVAWSADAHGEVLASASYDDTVRLWREDGEGEWGCVAVLRGHEGTVWAVAWEERGGEEDGAGAGGRRRLATCSADCSVRIWEREGGEVEVRGEGSGIPSTMRPRAAGETWVCVATLAGVHERAVYSVGWSGRTGRIVSTGSDSLVAVYEEGKGGWEVVARLELGHGPYEINHVVWCPRFDGGRKGGEEMVVTTGDDGVVMAWALAEG